MVSNQVRSTHRLTRTLKNSFPQALQWFQDKDTLLFGDVLSRWPPLKAGQRAYGSTLETFFREHHGRSEDVMIQRIDAIQAAIPLSTAKGLIAPDALLVQALVNPLHVTWQDRTPYDESVYLNALHCCDSALIHNLAQR